jgi:hypothetical protein
MIHGIPTWCRWHRGAAPILVIAPHGGSRPVVAGRDSHRQRKVNDLQTAELAAALAADLDASYVINGTVDRNSLDLNRISQVAAQATWFIALLEDLVEAILERHGHAEVMVVHGWNVVQAKCDLGIGVHLGSTDDDLDEDSQTVSQAFLRRRLATLVACARDAGAIASIGERYPGRHRNNLLQLFRRGPGPGDGDPELRTRLREWARAGVLDAVQLELGIPLRWPGPARESFRAAIGDAFSSSKGAAIEPPAIHVITPLAPPRALRFFDDANDIGMMTGIDLNPGRRGVNARVLLFLGGNRVALFTGEEHRANHFPNQGPIFAPIPGGFHFSFRGSTLDTTDGRRYVDLEDAFRDSVLRKLEIDLLFQAIGDDGYGMVRGDIHLDEQVWAVSTTGFADPGTWRRWRGARRAEWSISAAFGDDLGLQASSAMRHLRRIEPAATEDDPLHTVRVDLEDDLYTPKRLGLRTRDGTELTIEPLGQMAIVRPISPRRRAHVILGIGRAHLGSRRTGAAVYEYGRVLTY